jgi:quinol monooxygenase YgiN
MVITHVMIHVIPEFISAFIDATLENVKNSNLEPGILRFEFIQQEDAPERFVLVEIYKSPEDVTAHKSTVHYQKWRDTVAPMMAEPRRGVKYDAIFPEEILK